MIKIVIDVADAAHRSGKIVTIAAGAEIDPAIIPF
jgi:hypothetical protein